MHQTTSSVVLLYFPPCPSAPGCDTFCSQPLHLRLLLPLPQLMLQQCHHTQARFFSMTLTLISLFLPPPTLSYHLYPPLSLLWGDRVTSSLEGINCQRRTKREITNFFLPCCPVKKRAPLLQEGLESGSTIMHLLPYIHTHMHTHSRSILLSPSLTHTATRKDWLSSQSPLQAAACLGKPDAFLPPGRSTRCHLKGSLLGLIHLRLPG